MQQLLGVCVPVFFLGILIRLTAAPIRWIWKIFLNFACGFGCLWLLNSLAPFTGITYPVTPLAALIVGFLGLPGIGVLTLARYIL